VAKLAVTVRRNFLVGLALLLAPSPAIAAPPLPRPPCGVQPVPAYSRPGEAPAVQLWTKNDLATGWAPPACTPWKQDDATVVVGLAGSFNQPVGADTLLARLGAISSLATVRYWSVTEGQWNAMFVHAAALDDAKKPRRDFSAAELRAGGSYYFSAADNRSGKDAVSRLRIVTANSGHIAAEVENVTPLRWGFLTYAAPGNFQTWYFLDRDPGGAWQFYSLTRVLYASSLFATVIPGKSYINRAAAMYRHLLDVPTDQGPPAAP
jgi:hypothetical protein